MSLHSGTAPAVHHATGTHHGAPPFHVFLAGMAHGILLVPVTASVMHHPSHTLGNLANQNGGGYEQQDVC
jgi:hypothetical protein